MGLFEEIRILALFKRGIDYYVHPTGGWTYYFCFFRRPASHLVSRHFRQQFLSYLYQIWHAGLLG